MNLGLLTALTEAHGAPGREDAVRAIVVRELEPLVDSIHVDAMGSVHAVKRAGPGAKKLMIAAHMDEIGFVVRHIDSGGFVRLHPLGGWDPRQMASQRVVVHAAEGDLPGLLAFGTKPKHMLTDAEAAAKPEVEDAFVDLGLPEEKVKRLVSVGDTVTMDRKLLRLGKLLSNKAMDDRVGVYVMIEAIRAARSNGVEVHAVATVQEEIGLRGASAAGAAIAPDIVVALDVTLANDFLGIPEADHITRLGQGTAIKVLDGSLICHPKVVAHFRKLAETNKIPYQLEVLARGGTDAGGVQRLHGGIPSFTLSVPTRYIHTVNETVHEDDLQASVDLLARYIEDAHNGDYAY
jgi:endoglucanase